MREPQNLFAALHISEPAGPIGFDGISARDVKPGVLTIVIAMSKRQEPKRIVGLHFLGKVAECLLDVGSG